MVSAVGVCGELMTTGYILILATLLLGGVIATVGDRLGTKVGKARLSLFNLRPPANGGADYDFDGERDFGCNLRRVVSH